MRYKLISSDVDGTLLNNERVLSEENKLAVSKALSENIKFVLCSGRDTVALCNLADELNLTGKGTYVISFNGAIIYDVDNKKVIYEKRLPKTNINNLIDIILKKFPDIIFTAFLEHNVIITNRKEIKEYFSYLEILESSNNLDKDFIKISFASENSEQLKEVEKFLLESKSNENYDLVYSHRAVLDVIPLGINKANALKKLINYINDITMEEIVSVGDNYNDIEMVKESGYGIAVANSVEDLKKVADYITKNDNNNNAIKEVIDKVIDLNKKNKGQ